MDLYVEQFEIGQLIRDVEAIVQPLMEKNGNTLTRLCLRPTRPARGVPASRRVTEGLRSCGERVGSWRSHPA